MLRKHSATLHGHRTSFSLEEVFWDELRAIAQVRAMPLARLITEIDDARGPGSNLSSALRVHVLQWVKAHAQPHDEALRSEAVAAEGPAMEATEHA